MTSTYGPLSTSGTVISYLPLTTAWSAPASCSSLFLDTAGHLYLDAPEYHNGVSGSPECIPSEVSLWWYQSLNTASPTGILLGGYDFECPEAYTTAFSYFDGATSTIGCCQSQYTWDSTWWQHGNPYQCSSTIGPGTITYVTTQTGSSVYTTTSLSVSTSTIITGVQINGFKVVTASATATSTANPYHVTAAQSTSISSSSSSTTTTASTADSGDTSVTSHASGLTEQAKIGIGVGVSLGAITLVGGLILTWFLLRRKRPNSQTATIPHQPIIDPAPYMKPEMDSTPAPAKNFQSNPAAPSAHELGSSPKPQLQRPDLAEME